MKLVSFLRIPLALDFDFLENVVFDEKDYNDKGIITANFQFYSTKLEYLKIKIADA